MIGVLNFPCNEPLPCLQAESTLVLLSFKGVYRERETSGVAVEDLTDWC